MAHDPPAPVNPSSNPSGQPGDPAPFDATPSPEHGALPRVLGPFSAITVVVGSIIGSGIFLKPGAAAQAFAGTPDSFGLIIAVWVVVGLISLCAALALAELAAAMPQAGGPYIYLREAYGQVFAFLWGWTEFWVIRTGSVGALAAATVIYLNQMFTRGQEAGWSQTVQGALAIAIVVVLSLANIIGTKWGAWVQNVTSVIKVAFLAGLIVLPFLMGKANTDLLQPFFPETYAPNLHLAIAAAMVAVMWPYDGWINIGPVTEEIHHPQRNVPLALILGMGIVIVVYVSVNISYHLVLSISEIAESKAVAATVCERLVGPGLGSLVALGVACSTFGATNSNMMTGPRIWFAMARDGLLPGVLRKVHSRFQTPANAIAVQCAWTVLQIIAVYGYSKDPLAAFNALTDFVIFGGLIFYALTVAAVIVLRFKRPDLERPYKTWGYPVTPIAYLLLVGYVLASMPFTNPYESLAGTGLIAVGVPFYYVVRALRPKG
jgi:APA family basic amino acid/polyamine antiporter